ncbi:MAG: hypothetical protein A3G44_17200 [Candidatus Rokubacteria bacterium RIFCSPLOWO2_12_FULL_73_47]|nr:MAG: hypothetical protein A3G44_17200 [Candidatus Rokubacteria bacterium RIFCSPLOWO2_12_FULL_73_47]
MHARALLTEDPPLQAGHHPAEARRIGPLRAPRPAQSGIGRQPLDSPAGFPQKGAMTGIEP